MISGFTHPVTEFATPYRVINYHACNSCSNDRMHAADHRRTGQGRNPPHPGIQGGRRGGATPGVIPRRRR
jgi:hypothetical protein